MNKVLVFLFVGILCTGLSHALTLSASAQQKLARGESIEVFVQMDQPQGEFRAASQAESTSEHVEALLDKEVRYEYNEGFVSIRVSAEDLAKLEEDSRITSVSEVGVRQVFLTDSVPMINATQTHALQINGVNLTGAGRGICILDTGVNYNHSDLGGCYGNNNVSSSCKVWGGYDYVNNDADPFDDHGHGTHVSGIAAANGAIKGVAPEAHILSLKVCNSGGNCADSDIIAGINWCITNMSLFNISSISMSLGSGLNTGYCNSDPLTPYINNAVARNISVVIATGNGGSATQIAAPGCVQNATSVGAVYKSDLIEFNRNNITDILAPGVSITSTSYLGGYESRSGTSMATPHIAGTIALLRQYLAYAGVTKTPSQLEAILNVSGKWITDSSTGANYSRVRVYNAILSLDTSAPNVTLLQPGNNSYVTVQNRTFVCNASDLALSNVTFMLWNSTGLFAQSTQNISGSSYAYGTNVSTLPYGTYAWNCLYTDAANNYAFASSNNTFTSTSLDVTLISPLSGLKTRVNQTFVCNASSSTHLLSNVTFMLWNSTSLISNVLRNVSGMYNSTTFLANFTTEDSYSWNCLFVDNSSARTFAPSNYSLTYDLRAPNVSVFSPVNNQTLNAGRFNVSLSENGTCLYSLDNGLTNVSMTQTNFNFSAVNTTLTHNNFYNVSYYCTDSAGNLNTTQRVGFSIDRVAPNVTLVSPAPADGYTETSSNAALVFAYQAQDNLSISSCTFYLNGATQAINSSITNQSLTYQFEQSITPGSNYWQINCTDSAGNIGATAQRSFTINAPASVSSTGGGGGGGGSGTVSLNPNRTNTQNQTATNQTIALSPTPDTEKNGSGSLRPGLSPDSTKEQTQNQRKDVAVIASVAAYVQEHKSVWILLVIALGLCGAFLIGSRIYRQRQITALQNQQPSLMVVSPHDAAHRGSHHHTSHSKDSHHHKHKHR